MIRVLASIDTAADITSEVEPNGPTNEELAAIEAEWPLIEAEMAVVDAEVRLITAEPHPTELDRRRLRRAERELARIAVELVTRSERSNPSIRIAA